MGSDLGINSISPLRPNPMRPLICNGQVFKSRSLVLQVFFFLSSTTMSTLEDQIAAEEAHIAEEMTDFEKQKVELGLLWKAVKEEAKWRKAEEEQKQKEEEEKKKKRVEEERKCKEVEEKEWVEEEKKQEEEEEETRKKLEVEKQR